MTVDFQFKKEKEKNETCGKSGMTVFPVTEQEKVVLLYSVVQYCQSNLTLPCMSVLPQKWHVWILNECFLLRNFLISRQNGCHMNLCHFQFRVYFQHLVAVYFFCHYSLFSMSIVTKKRRESTLHHLVYKEEEWWGQNGSEGKLVVTRGTEQSPAGLPEAFKDVVELGFRQALPRNGRSYLHWQQGWKPDMPPSFSQRFSLLPSRCWLL